MRIPVTWLRGLFGSFAVLLGLGLLSCGHVPHPAPITIDIVTVQTGPNATDSKCLVIPSDPAVTHYLHSAVSWHSQDENSYEVHIQQGCSDWDGSKIIAVPAHSTSKELDLSKCKQDDTAVLYVVYNTKTAAQCSYDSGFKGNGPSPTDPPLGIRIRP